MNYWLVKARRRNWMFRGERLENRFESMLSKDRVGNWFTKRPPKNLAKGDRLFFWESSPGAQLVGLGEIVNPNVREEEGSRTYRVRYLTGVLEDKPNLGELRENASLANASFLKSGPAMSVFAVRNEEAIALFNEVLRRNPELGELWPDIVRLGIAPLEIDLMTAAREGQRKLCIHLSCERNRKLISDKKRSVLAEKKKLDCEVCRFNFFAKYGERGLEFCEVHHRIPISTFDGERITKLSDLAIVCSNCHRMLHIRPWLTIHKLRKSIAVI